MLKHMSMPEREPLEEEGAPSEAPGTARRMRVMTWREALALPLGLLGAVLGAAAGGFVFYYASRLGLGGGVFYPIPLVGIAAGFGAPLLARRGGPVLGVMAAVVALLGSLISEGIAFPFNADPSLAYFLTHVNELSGVQLFLHALGAVIAGWIAWTAPVRG